MSQDITRRRVVYEMQNEDTVVVRNDLEFPGADGRPLTFDLYRPRDNDARPPAVVLVAGFPDAGTQKILARQREKIAQQAAAKPAAPGAPAAH